MPRAKSQSREALVESAMKTFWHTGYNVVSIGDLVRETGVSRAGIYNDFSGKQGLFHACLDHYQDVIVTPAFAAIEETDAGIEAIGAYLDNLLNMYGSKEGFGVGCLVGNTLTQIPVDETETRQKLQDHCFRLTAGFRKALVHENRAVGLLSDAEIDDLARYTMISVQGLWSYSRLTKDISELRAYSATLLAFLRRHLHAIAV